MSDDEYQLWIKARVVLNHSRGTAEDIYKLLQVILGKQVRLKIIEHPESAFTVEILEHLVPHIERIFALLAAAKPLGVQLLLHHGVKNPVFKFDNSAHKKGYFSTLIC